MLIQNPLSPAQLQQLHDLPIHWVKTQDALFALLDDLEQVDTIALDTEFIKRDTFFPILALIQINTGEAIYLIDAPKLYLEEFWQVVRAIRTEFAAWRVARDYRGNQRHSSIRRYQAW